MTQYAKAMSRYAEHALNIHQHEPQRIAIPLLTRESQKHPDGQSIARRFAVGTSLFYASTLGVVGTYLPFFPVWLKAIGIDASWIGVITAVPSFSRFTILPFVTAFAERRRILRGAMVALAFLTAAGFSVLGLFHHPVAILIVDPGLSSSGRPPSRLPVRIFGPPRS